MNQRVLRRYWIVMIALSIFLMMFTFVTPVLADKDKSAREHNEDESKKHNSKHKKSKDFGVTFENVSDLLGPYARAFGGEGIGGIAWLDYDQDGHLDIYVTNSFKGANALFRNNGDGTFTDVAQMAGVASATGHSGIVVGDIDNDGYPDIFLTGEGNAVGPLQTPTVFYHNNGNGTFTDITALSGVIGAATASSVTMGDINNDGYLDIFIASPGHFPLFPVTGPARSDENKLYLNNGDLTFTDITISAGVTGLYVDEFGDTVSDGACVATFSDYNRDGLIDIFVGNCNGFISPRITGVQGVVRDTPFNLYRNNGDNTFTDIAESAGLGLLNAWMGLAFGDYDNDGDIDLFATNLGTFKPTDSSIAPAPHALFRNNGDGTYTEVSAEAGIPNSEFSWGVTFVDFDNNGGLDIYQVGSLPGFGAIGPGVGNPGSLYFNDGKGNFTEESHVTGLDLSSKYTSGLAQGDFDGDGFADIAIMTAAFIGGDFDVPSEDFILLRNQGNRNNWLTIRLVGTTSNRDGIGAHIQVKTKKHYQLREVIAGSSFLSSESPWPSFGLGKHDEAKITVTWPSGLVESFGKKDANQIVTLTEGSGKQKKAKKREKDHHHDDEKHKEDH